MTLERKSAGRFTYEGTVDGEPKKGAFTAKGPLFTRLSRSKLVAAVAREESRKPLPLLHFEERVPEAATREMVTREGPNQVLMDSGKKSYHCIVDARGVCATTWRDGSSVKLERVYVTGNL